MGDVLMKRKSVSVFNIRSTIVFWNKPPDPMQFHHLFIILPLNTFRFISLSILCFFIFLCFTVFLLLFTIIFITFGSGFDKLISLVEKYGSSAPS